jgi:putative tryptophan/tyrosine transport system substrate-binding protein
LTILWKELEGWRNAFLGCAVVLLALYTPLACAYTGVTIVISAPTQTNLEFIDRFKEELASTKAQTLSVKVIEINDSERLVVAENSELVIALGTKALSAASKLKHSTPVLGVFTPLPAFNEMLDKSRRDLGNFSAIVLDQPFRRQFALMRVLLPGAKRVGVLLGTTSIQSTDYLAEPADRFGFGVNSESVAQEAELIPKLNKVLDANDALLAIPDPLIYNRETVQPILLTSYRHQKPVFGFSQSYARAGALAAVFSSTRDLAKQAVEIAIGAQQAPNILPPPQIPKYFTVQLNHQVLRALNLSEMDDEEVHKKLMMLESAQHMGVDGK